MPAAAPDDRSRVRAGESGVTTATVLAIVRPGSTSDHRGGTLPPMSSTSLLDAYLKWLAAGDTAAATLRLRRRQLECFGARVDLALATEADLIAWLARPTIATETRRSQKSGLSGFYRWAYRAGHLDADPSAGLHRIRPSNGLPHPISEAGLERALRLADPQTEGMVLLGSYAGLRLSELTSFHERAITDSGLIITGKGGKTRRIPIHSRLRPFLDRVVGAGTGWAFPSPWPSRPDQACSVSYVQHQLAAVLPADASAHSLRHRFATATYKACRDITIVQRLLGHASVATTMRYVALVDDDLDLAIGMVA